MVHQIELWEYIRVFKRTDTVARRFGLTVEQANHSLQKLENHGHAQKRRTGTYTSWKAIPDNPPRRYALTQDEKDTRKETLICWMAFEGECYISRIAEGTGISQRLLVDILRGLRDEGLVEMTGRKWRLK